MFNTRFTETTAAFVNGLAAKAHPQWAALDVIHHHSLERPQTMYAASVTLFIYFVFSFAACIVVDFFVTRPLTYFVGKAMGVPKWDYAVAKRNSWYLLHTLLNICVLLWALDEAAFCLLHPSEMFSGWYGTHPGAFLTTAVVFAFHIHHFCFFQFTFEDIIHHLGNAGLVALIGLFTPWNKSTSLSNSALCGWPGAFNYGALWLSKVRLMDRVTVKYVSRWTNLVLRLPAVLLTVLGFAIAVNKGTCPIEVMSFTFVVMAAGALAHTANAVYYADQVVGNYHVTVHNVKEERKAAKAAASAEGKKKQ